MASTFNPQRDITEVFKSRVADWIAAGGEVFVVLRYLRSAGSKDYAFCHSKDDFMRVIGSVPDGTDIIVFRNKQLPFRGLCSPMFVDQVLRAIPDGEEYMAVANLSPSSSDLRCHGRMGGTHRDLMEDLQDWMGQLVAVGPCPPFFEEDNETMISASKGGIDGPR